MTDSFENDSNPFKIAYKDNCLLLNDSTLPRIQEEYLQSYLDQVNHYRPIGTYQGSPVFSIYQPPLATKAGERSLYFRLKRRFDNVRIPASATIAVNKACQCNCQHCSAVFYNTSSRKELSPFLLKQAILETSNLGATNIILLGGEPLLRKGLPSLISAVDKDLSVVTMFTNGEFLSREKCRALKEAGLLGAFVSIDTADPEKHDTLRCRPGLFAKAMEGIQNLKHSGILVAISSYLSPQRIEEDGFEEILELGKKIDVNEITFFDAIPSGRWLKDGSCLLQPRDRKIIRDKVRYYRGLDGYPGLSVQSTMTSECGSAFCFAANTQFYLTAFGEMCPCDFTPLTIGAYPNSSIEELWRRMITTPPYHLRAKSCRMQDSDFRKKYIETLRNSGPFPYPFQSI